MSELFERWFEVGWRHVDPNGHVANMTYLEYAVDTRIAFFAANGFPPTSFLNEGFGPVIKSDFVEYFRETVMLDRLRVTIENAGNSGDFSRFKVVNAIYKVDGEMAARVTTVGGWLDLKSRKLMEPPDIIKAAWRSLTKTEDFQELPSSIKK
jgi:acyl-CoA thioester hydrolase